MYIDLYSYLIMLPLCQGNVGYRTVGLKLLKSKVEEDIHTTSQWSMIVTQNTTVNCLCSQQIETRERTLCVNHFTPR